MEDFVNQMANAFEDELRKIASSKDVADAAKAIGRHASKLPLGSMAAGAALTVGGQRAYKDWKTGRAMRKQMAQQGY